MPPLGHLVIVNACGGNGMPRRTYGLATRARRPRPSEKTGPNVIPGFPRKAILPWMSLPAEGRAPHARNKTIGPTQACPR
jgi:hypothetical protein